MAKGIIVRALGGFDKKLLIVARGLTPGTAATLIITTQTAVADPYAQTAIQEPDSQTGGIG